MTVRRLLLALLLLFLAGCQSQGCEVTEKAAVPLQFIDNIPLVPVQINGTPGLMVLDTGAGRTTLSVKGVERHGLKLDRWVGSTLYGVGGVEQHQNTLPDSFTIGALALHQRGIWGLSLSVAPLPAAIDAADGLLGRDLLQAYDLDIDIPKRRLALYDVNGCSGRFLPWTQPYRAVPMLPAFGNAMVFLSTLDGHALRTMLDSGTAMSLLTSPGQFHAGPGVLTSGHATIVGIGPQRLSGQVRQYADLAVAGVVEMNPLLLTTEMHFPLDLLLGRRLAAQPPRLAVLCHRTALRRIALNASDTRSKSRRIGFR